MQNAVLEASAKDQDLVLLSPTGSGKTLAFLLPMLQHIDATKMGVQALIIVPSRELALQIETVVKTMGTGFKVNSCYGGHSAKVEENNFSQPPAILIGTPGRIADHLKRNSFDPSTIETLILDEFDKALELGFSEDMSYVIGKLQHLKRRLLTSATPLKDIPSFVGLKQVKTLSFLNAEEIKPSYAIRTVSTIAEDKLPVLVDLIKHIGAKNTLIFCNHREAVDRISNLLKQHKVLHESFHGGMEQIDRERALLKFRNGSSQILITTDLAARGLDIPEVEAIVHYQLPPKEDAFIHRNGRTARMKASGTVYLIMTEEDDCPFIDNSIPEEKLNPKAPLPKPAIFETLYISAGKKDKINKIDIVGFLIKTGGLDKEDVGLIEVKDVNSFVAVKRNKVKALLKNIVGKKIKGQKPKIDVAR